MHHTLYHSINTKEGLIVEDEITHGTYYTRFSFSFLPQPYLPRFAHTEFVNPLVS